MAKLTFQLVEQISGIWNKLGVNQRASLLGSSFLLVFGMVALIVWSSRPEYRLLYGGLDDASAAKVIGSKGDWHPHTHDCQLSQYLSAKGQGSKGDCNYLCCLSGGRCPSRLLTEG